MPPFSRQVASAKRFREWLHEDNGFYAKLLGSAAVGILTICILVGCLCIFAISDQRKDESSEQSLKIVRLCTQTQAEMLNLDALRSAKALTGHDDFLVGQNAKIKQIQSRLRDLRMEFSPDNPLLQNCVQAGQKFDYWLSSSGLV